MKLPYTVYYIDKSNRIECMLVCSLTKSINWYESGLKIVSWKYKKTHQGQSESINEVFKNHSRIVFDKRRKIQLRTINIGDIIVYDEIPYIIAAFGFIRIPDLLWKRMKVE